MPLSLTELRTAAQAHLIEGDPVGFNIERSDTDPESFNRLVRDALESGGTDFVAFPKTDGHSGYSGLYVIPLD